MTNWAPGTVVVKTEGGGKESVTASVRGPFAVHLTHMTDGSFNGWTLTHGPSGYALAQELPSQACAEELAGAIEHLLDWNAFTPAGYRTLDPLIALEVRRQIKKHRIAHAPELPRADVAKGAV